MILNLKEIIKSDTALSPDAGSTIFSLINRGLLERQDIKLDFYGIEVVTSAFLNAAIGQLYSKFESKDLNEHLKIVNLPIEDRALLRKVIERAKDYFQDQKSFEERMDDLYGDE
ncbi:STAS-like domain-containing protein [Mucilaginibacter rubeus]|nr:STAS-like domain-containing protein [Mucilaginibacter rubeus]